MGTPSQMSHLDTSIVDPKNDKDFRGTVTTNAKSDESSVALDDSFEDLGNDEYYVQFTELVIMGFVEIT